jgi:hypothetical protein
LLRDKTSDGLT